jgi:Fe-Mn family superoxide dismutase
MEHRKKRRFIISEHGDPLGAPAAPRRRSTPLEKPEGEVARESRTDRFAARDFTPLLGMPGFSEELLKNHFELYQGYVKNANALLTELEQLTRQHKLDSPAAAEMRRRFGWEYDGIRLHEFYFENLAKSPKPLDPQSRLSLRLNEDFGGVEHWKKDFEAAASMRGIGWVVAYHDPLRNRLFNAWINEHDEGHLVACSPIVVLDVFEHAYLTDYGVKKTVYIESFFRNLNWDAATRRLP